MLPGCLAQKHGLSAGPAETTPFGTGLSKSRGGIRVTVPYSGT